MSATISVTFGSDPEVRGYLVIDSTVNGRAYGGLRLSPDVSAATLARVARAKTLKYGLLGLPLGGAKAGIAAAAEIPAERRRELLKGFGEIIKPYLESRRFVPGEDLGTTAGDIRYMLEANGLKVPPRSLSEGSGTFTAVTVFAAAVSACEYAGVDLHGAAVAVEGFGSVGAPTALAFSKGGARVVAISTVLGGIYDEAGLDVAELSRLRDRVGDAVVNIYPKARRIDRQVLPELDVHVFSPCAQPDSITEANVGSVQAKVICPGANCPVTPEAERNLFQRGIVPVPDFVANCGGVLGVSMRRAGIMTGDIERYIGRKVAREVTGILEAARAENVVPRVPAERVAEERFARAKAQAESRSVVGRAFGLGLELYRAGAIPRWLVAPLAPRYFDSRVR